MAEHSLRRAALFQYAWPLQSHVVNLVRSLASAGIEVDLFLRECRTDLVELSVLLATPGVAVHDLSDRAGPSLMGRIARRLRFVAVDEGAVHRALSLAAGRAAQIYIGIEKRGLIWAGMVADRTGVPFVYHSLELYDDEHPEARKQPHFLRLRAMERHYHARARATIVQDEARAACLLRSNRVERGNLIILPVSVAGCAVERKGNHLREHLRLPPGRPVLLYLGLFSEARGCLRIADLARSHGNDFAVVFHGYGAPTMVRRLRKAGAFVSTQLVPPGCLAELVSSADVGLAFYRPDCANDRLTAFSSEKVALYCQAGIPFIARDSASYRHLLAQFRCAETVVDPAGIPAAARRILEDYAAYRSQAQRAFEVHYRFDAHAQRLVEQLRGLVSSSPRRPALSA